jgi:hypothetical protein
MTLKVNSSLDGLLYYILYLDKHKYHLFRVVKQLHKVLLVCRPSENTKNVWGSNIYKISIILIYEELVSSKYTLRAECPMAPPFKTT